MGKTRKIECGVCWGTGEVSRDINGEIEEEQTCEYCNGTGLVLVKA